MAEAHTASDDRLVDLDHHLAEAEHAYGVALRAEDDAADAAGERTHAILAEMAKTPITSLAGVAVLTRCLLYGSSAGGSEFDRDFALSILGWIGQQTGRDETVGGLVEAEDRA